MYSAMIPSENKIRPEKKEIMITVDVHPGTDFKAREKLSDAKTRP